MAIKLIKIKPEFVDDRGYISRVIDQNKLKIRSILYIERKAGTVGGNHYHKKDYHYIFCLSGKIKYIEKDMSSQDAKSEFVIMKAGDLVLSHPMIAHTTEFIEDTVFLAFTTENRNQKAYERDTVRIQLSD